MDSGRFFESNTNNFGLHIDFEDYSAVLLHLGMCVATHSDSRVDGYTGVFVRYDVLDETSKLHNSFKFASAVQFTAQRENSNGINAYFQTGLGIDLRKNASLQVEYTFGIAENYTSHGLG